MISTARSTFFFSLAILALSIPAKAAIVTSGLIEDLNPNLGTTVSGGVLTAWANQGSGGDNVTRYGGDTPLLLNSGLAGNKVVALQADRLTGTNNTAFDTTMNGGGHTWFAVVRAGQQTPGDPKNAIFGTLNDGGNFSGFVAHLSATSPTATTPSYLLRPISTDNLLTSSANIIGQKFHVISGRLSAGTGSRTAEIMVDGQLVGSMPVTISAATDSGGIGIGMERFNGGETMEGYLGRILVYNRPLTNAELQQTGDDLAKSYGLAYGSATYGKTMVWNFNNGTLADTTGTNTFTVASGTAFSALPIPYTATDAFDPYDGGTHLVRSDFFNNGTTTSKPGDGPTGSLVSGAFTLGLNAGFMFEAAGAGGVFELVDANTLAVLASVAPNRMTTTLEAFSMDASAFAGRSVFLRITDNSSGGWGHIAIDNIVYSALAADAAPEPSSLLLVAMAIGGVGAIKRRRQS